MTQGFVGQDIAKMRELEQTLRSGGEQLSGVRFATARVIDGLNSLWRGNVVDAFTHLWHSRHAVQIEQAKQSLLDAAEIVSRNLEAQVQTSDTLERSGAAANGPTTGRSNQTSDSRSELDRILKDYQVDSVEMVEFGKWYLPGMTLEVTATEAELLSKLGPHGIYRMNSIKDTAFGVAGDNYFADGSPYSLNDGHNDAFRHAYWNALMTKEFGEEWTEAFATAHEASPENPAAREAMDLYNNEIGRRIATENPNASDEELARLIRGAVEDGELVVVDQNGNLEFSDKVEFGQHGVTPDVAGPGGLQVDDVANPDSRAANPNSGRAS